MIRFDAKAQSTPRYSSRACFPAYHAHKPCIGVSPFARQCHRADGGLISDGTCFVALMIIPTLDTSANRQLPLSTRSSDWLHSLGLDTFPRMILASATCHLHTLIYDDIIAEVGRNIVNSFQTLMKISSFNISPGKVRIVVRYGQTRAPRRLCPRQASLPVPGIYIETRVSIVRGRAWFSSTCLKA